MRKELEGIALTIDDFLYHGKYNKTELANSLGIIRGNYSLSDFMKMMDILECDIQIVARDSKKIFD